MKNIIHVISMISFFLIISFMSFVAGLSFYKLVEIQRHIKNINSTLEYIDKRMDTLEFFKSPEK